ncbi:hypothetical protein ACFU53_44460 [Streptomyces sp. NPDC057474]|uniref:hypothetical protein n=1 Tax=Streptomyces sp. NPDC057474 TaxID=3346144 RepID=UPI00369561B4
MRCVAVDYSVLTDHISTETYPQHNPEAADGLDGFGTASVARVIASIPAELPHSHGLF